MPIPCYFVDSFTDCAFKGNPAAVCLPDHNLSDIYMQQIANEIGFSETAFIYKLEDRKYRIRYFTPKMEIPLCGHATLAAAKILFSQSDLQSLTFINIEDIHIPVSQYGNEIGFQFPIYPIQEFEVADKTLMALGLSSIVNSFYVEKHKIVGIEIESDITLASLSPNFTALTESIQHINGILVTAKSGDPNYDFQYRYFWPWAGTNEDPVTGGVHTFLTPYWAKKLNQQNLKAYQSSARGGNLRTQLHPDHVQLFGEAVIMLEGQFKL